jgi:hypothetical protein
VIFLDVRKTILRPNTLTESLKITLGEEWKEIFHFKSIMVVMPVHR